MDLHRFLGEMLSPRNKCRGPIGLVPFAGAQNKNAVFPDCAQIPNFHCIKALGVCIHVISGIYFRVCIGCK